MQVNSLPIRVTAGGRARNCYWPMPFQKSARITVTNEGEKRTDKFYYYIDWQKLDKWPGNTGYFHAQYRQEYPCVMGRDYLILDAEGSGHYKPFPPLPPARERLYKSVSEEGGFTIEGESLIESSEASDGRPVRQNLPAWSGGAHLFYMPSSAPASLKVKFELPKAGRYAMTANLTRAPDYGIYRISVDGDTVGRLAHLYSGIGVIETLVSLGAWEFTEGEHAVLFTLIGKNSQSSGYFFGLDNIELVPLDE